MKKIVLGALGPALIVAALQWVLLLVLFVAEVNGQSFAAQPLLYADMAWSQATA